MTRYRIEFSDDAKNDIMRSYEWGREKWGPDAARRWYQDVRQQTRKVLTHLPLAQPIAPESEEVVGEIHNLIFGRYRILFEIIGDTVRVLHVRGAFIDNENIDFGVNE